jgi:hypothetical protein
MNMQVALLGRYNGHKWIFGEVECTDREEVPVTDGSGVGVCSARVRWRGLRELYV